ncbi:MAG: sulfotransferase family protein [Gaiellaceae bacterium]
MAGSDRPIFVLGCPRSGTTLVQVMLHSHPRIAVPPENRFLIPAYRQRLRFGNLEEPANRRAVAEFILRRRKRFRDLGLDRQETIDRIVAGPPTLGSAIGSVLQAYAERFDRPRWGDKRPHYTHFIDALMRLFPDAQIVNVIRDPRDCVASLKRMPWWKRSSYYAVSAWADAIDHVGRASRRWPGVVVPLRYERLTADPESELRALCAALGEDYEPAMAEPERVADVAVPERKHWHSRTRVGPTTERIGRWREGLEPWEVALCETVLAERMTGLGYELTGSTRPRAEHLLRYARVRAERKLRHRAWTLKDVWLRRREPNPVAALLTSGQRASAGRQEVVQ